MDVIRVFNGLGNQMSQYAFYYAKKRCKPYKTCYITNRYDTENIHNGYELERVFGIKAGGWKNKILYYILSSLYKPVFGYRFLSKIAHTINEKDNYDFDERLLLPSPFWGFTFYWGGWHSEKYFKKYRGELLELFRFNETKLNEESKKYLKIINEDFLSCSLHVRRGDYLNNKKWSDAVPQDYYVRAVDHIKNKFQFVTFYVFSNDIGWCKNIFGEKGFVYVDCNDGFDSWQDMFLMSKCHHHINANSSFSWWGAWLCQHPASITVVPRNFVCGMDVKDVYPDAWVKI